MPHSLPAGSTVQLTRRARPAPLPLALAGEDVPCHPRAPLELASRVLRLRGPRHRPLPTVHAGPHRLPRRLDLPHPSTPARPAAAHIQARRTPAPDPARTEVPHFPGKTSSCAGASHALVAMYRLGVLVRTRLHGRERLAAGLAAEPVGAGAAPCCSPPISRSCSGSGRRVRCRRGRPSSRSRCKRSPSGSIWLSKTSSPPRSPPE